MIDPAEILLELYEVRSEVERNAYRRFTMGLGEAYPEELRQIDGQIAEIEKRRPKGPSIDFNLTSPRESSIQTTIYINDKEGIYIDAERKYSVAGKRRQFVLKLLESESLTAEELKESFWTTSSQITNEINKINSLVREKLVIEQDLIKHSKSARNYSLNREELNIEAS